MAIIIFPKVKKMSIMFYIGGIIILISIFINTYLKKNIKQSQTLFYIFVQIK